MIALWKKFREAFVILGMVGLFSGLVYFGILRVFEKNREKLSAIQEALTDRKILDEERGRIPEMRNEANMIDAASDRTRVFLGKDEIVSLAERVETMGSELGVAVVSEASSVTAAPAPKKSATKKPTPAESSESELNGSSGKTGSKEKEEEKLETIASILPVERSVFVVFKVTGQYDRVVAFAEKLDAFPNLLDVLSIEIVPAPEEEASSGGAAPAPRLSTDAINVFSGRSAGTGTSSDIPKATPQMPHSVLASFQTALYLKR